MYIIIVGGGKVGYYLTKTLLSEGHEVLLIEKNPEKTELFVEQFGAVVVAGDGAEAGPRIAERELDARRLRRLEERIDHELHR